jgi:hypothetical protein
MKPRLVMLAAMLLALASCTEATTGGPTVTTPASTTNGRPAASEGQMCGGIAGVACAANLYCNYPQTAQCGAADQSGVCATKPQACTRDYRPVCGCDDHTYGNACTAAAAGISVAHDGACTTAPSTP